MMIRQVHVRKTELYDATLADLAKGDLADGAARLQIESFSVTANNITYAVVGDGFGYWNFFPAPEGLGIVPMWGHAKESRVNVPILQWVSGSMVTCQWAHIWMWCRVTSQLRDFPI